MTPASAIIQFFFRAFDARRVIAKQFRNPPRNTGNMEAGKFGSRFLTDEWHVDGFQVITIRDKSKPSPRHIVFFHGGAYVVEASPIHRQIIKTFVRKYGFTVTFVDYPKAPEHTFQTTHKVILEAYLQITAKNPQDEFFLFGDSAGGGLALAFLQVLRDVKVTPFPKKTGLMSPWVDITMTNEKIKDYEKSDPVLHPDPLIFAGKQYAGSEDPKNPLISPIYGDLDNLGPILILTGTSEILYPDSIELAEKLMKVPGSFPELIVAPGLMHDYIMLPTADGRKAIRQLVTFYLG